MCVRWRELSHLPMSLSTLGRDAAALRCDLGAGGGMEGSVTPSAAAQYSARAMTEERTQYPGQRRQRSSPPEGEGPTKPAGP